MHTAECNPAQLEQLASAFHTLGVHPGDAWLSSYLNALEAKEVG